MNKKNNKISNGVKNIFKKTLKFISSRLTYLIIGIFLAIGATYVYAAWNDAKTGDSGQLSQSNWNALVNEIHNKCGSNCDVKATAATASSDILTENNWNNLVDLTSNTLVDCADNNGGKCFINQTSKSALATDLVAGNIKSGATIFGITGTLCTSGGSAQTTNWGANTYGCIGSDKRCINGGCVTCGGWINAGYCWYNAGATSISCNTTCGNHGGVYNNSCDWINDPIDCSTCLHYYPGAGCGDYEGAGPYKKEPNSYCVRHSDGISWCDWAGPAGIVMCGCNF